MVRWSLRAKGDLREIYNYIAKDSKYYAKRVVNNIVEKTEILESSPEIGRKVPEISEPNVREIFVYSYRIIYEIKRGELDILAVIHGRRDFLSAFAE